MAHLVKGMAGFWLPLIPAEVWRPGALPWLEGRLVTVEAVISSPSPHTPVSPQLGAGLTTHPHTGTFTRGQWFRVTFW